MKGVGQMWVVASMIGVSLLISSAGVFAVDVTDADRAFSNFIHETATVAQGQLRLEVRGMKEQAEIPSEDQNELDPHINVARQLVQPQGRDAIQDLNSGFIDLVASYGLGKNAEVGLDFPGYFESKRVKNLDTGAKSSEQSNDLGDVLLYTKFKHSVAEHCSVGAGMELSLPTGRSARNLGTGELGFNPFLSTRYQRGPIAVGANVGYDMYTGSVPGVFNYGAEAIWRGSEVYALRVEVDGRTFTLGKKWNDTLVFPGVDVNISDRITVRPTGMAGLTGPAMDWGIGVGIAVTL